MRKSKHGGTFSSWPSLSTTSTYASSSASQPHDFASPVSWVNRVTLDWSWFGLKWVPPDCAAIVKR